VERSHSRPMLDLDVLRNGSFVALMIGVLVMQGAAFSRLPYALDWLQSALGLGPMAAGLVGSVPLSAAVFVVALLTGKFLQHLNARIPIGIGLLLLAAGLFLQVNLTADSGGAALVAGLLVSGIGVGMINPVLTSASIAALPKAKAGIAGGVVNTFRQLGFAIGIALFGAVFANRVTGSLTQGGRFSQADAATIMHGGGVGDVLAAAPAGQRDLLAHAVRGAFASGVNHIHLIAGIAAAVSAILVFLLVGRRATAEEQPGAPTPTATGGSVR
jgi:hypothetical protein